MTEKVQEYESLLRDLTSRVSEQDAELIQRALEKVCHLIFRFISV
jgi:hypothetical protein